MMPLLSKSEVPMLLPFSVAVYSRFVLDLIGSSEDRFSHDAAHIISLFPCLKINFIFCFDGHKQIKTKKKYTVPLMVGRAVPD